MTKNDEKAVTKKQGHREIGKWMEPDVEAGDNAKFLGVSIKLYNMPTIDLKDSVAVQDRLNEYFRIYAEADLKPTVAGMAMALGIDRRRLWEIKSGAKMGGHTDIDLPTLTVDSIKKAYALLENQWENYMQQGKINPVSGIFLAKNNFGYRDQQEMVLTPNTNNEPDYDIDAIKKRLSTSTIEVDTDSDD